MIEKHGTVTADECNVHSLIKKAADNGAVLVVNFSSGVPGKEAVVVVATGPRAANLMRILEAASE